jgi:hypothetical protein
MTTYDFTEDDDKTKSLKRRKHQLNSGVPGEKNSEYVKVRICRFC